ncbi:MAG: M24 family metallopeptidase, partial [Flavobacteriales bacterium]
MINKRTKEEIELARESALVVSRTLTLIAEKIAPGVTPLELDEIAEENINKEGGVPGFKGYKGFPNSLCISVNERVVHGIPTNTPLEDGDIVSIDCGVKKNGFFGDHAYTFMVGNV